MRAPSDTRLTREIVTPEGIPLSWRVAPVGNRIGAVVNDTCRLWLVVILVGIAAGLTAQVFAEEIILSAFTVWMFLYRIFYFSRHELRSNGSTPGKRRGNLRVVDALGGRLRPEAVLVRNFTREVEFTLPITVMVFPQNFPIDSTPLRLAALSWLLSVSLLPLFNSERRRFGDFLGGTMVIKIDQPQLRSAVFQSPSLAKPDRSQPAFEFEPKHLGIYGNYELTTLETLLRAPASKSQEKRLVADRIASRIGWTEPIAAASVDRFLRAFYQAQRSYLEERLLFGHSKERREVEPDRAP